MVDPFKPSPLLEELRSVAHAWGTSGAPLGQLLERAAKRLEAFERGAQQRALIEGLPCSCKKNDKP
jgi:hypothetical protein